MMRKKILFIGLLLILFSSVYAQATEKSDEHFIVSTVGLGAPGVSIGFDYIYRHRTGFLIFCNLNISIPISRKAGIIFHPEIYLGYSIKYENLYVSFGTGFWGGGGFVFYAVPDSQISGVDWEDTVFWMVGIRNDYIYFFNKKMGFSFSHTHGLGIYNGRWFTENDLSYYSMQLKFGLAFRI